MLNICLGRAVDLNLISGNVAQVMRRRMPKAEPADFVVLTPEQSTELLNAARGSALFAPILLALSTGCRRGEAAASPLLVDAARGLAISWSWSTTALGRGHRRAVRAASR